MSELPDRSAVWLEILKCLLQPDLLATNTIDDVVKMADKLEQAHGRRWRPQEKSGEDARVVSIISKWAGSDDTSSRIMCIKELRRELHLDLREARTLMDMHWPKQPDPGGVF